MSLGICLVDLLEKLHGKGYIHCDLKPENIMIGNVSRDKANMNKIYLAEFGRS
jgi:serine/threonine protein kinase